MSDTFVVIRLCVVLKCFRFVMSLSNEEYYEMILCVGAADGSLRAARELYRQRFVDGRPPDEARRLPSLACFSRMVHRLHTTGSFHAPVPMGRARTRDPEFEETVLAHFEDNPRTSTRRAALELGAANHLQVWRVLHADRQHPYHFRRTQELVPADFQPRVTFCEWYRLQVEASPEFALKVLWTDEASFTRGGISNIHNEHYWSHTNPHVSTESSFQHQWRINVWAGIIGDVVVGPYFLPHSLNGNNYLEFLMHNLDEELMVLPVSSYVDLVIDNNMVYQHDGAPAHFARDVRNHLNDRFSLWIGRGGRVAWPARSPDLTPIDFFLWGYIKSKVYAVECQSRDEMMERITDAFRTVTQEMLRNVRNSLYRRAGLCIQQGGRHFEPLL